MYYSCYIYDDPCIDMQVRGFRFPGITDAVRKRSQIDLDLKWEI